MALTRLSCSVLALICLTTSSLVGQEVTQAGKEKGKPSPLLQRVAVVGASVSGGFRSDLPVAMALEHGIRVSHTTVLDTAAVEFGFDAVFYGEHQIDRCLEHEPTIVVGIDFLFWYGYGVAPRGEDELEARLEKLKLGLAQLDRLSCPVVVGDLPDMSGADSRFLQPVMIPNRAVLVELNKHIVAWSDLKKNVLLCPLAEWMKTLSAGKWKIPATRDARGPETVLTTEESLQDDGLHPSRIGAAVLIDRVIRRMGERFGRQVEGIELDVWEEVSRLRREQAAARRVAPKAAEK